MLDWRLIDRGLLFLSVIIGAWDKDKRIIKMGFHGADSLMI